MARPPLVQSLMSSKIHISLTLFILLVGARAEEVDFNRDIRRILSDKCFHCHGPDAQGQKSKFRIDTRENALTDHDGMRGIVPGDLEQSEVHHRIHLADDDDDRMPPLDSNRSLSKREKELLDAWILQGAEYDLHWSFKPVVRPELPNLKESKFQDRVENPIDQFCLCPTGA